MDNHWDLLIDGRITEALEYDYDTGRAYIYPETDIPEPEILEIYETKPIRNPKAKKSRRWVPRKKNSPGYFRGRNPKNSSRNPDKYWDRETQGGALAESLWASRPQHAPVGLVASLESRLARVRKLDAAIRNSQNGNA